MADGAETRPGSVAGSAWRRAASLFSRYGIAAALLLLVVFNAIMSPVFLKPENLVNILRQVSFVGTIAVGMTFVIVSGGIDLSVGSLAGLTGGLVIIIMNTVIASAGAGVGAELAGATTGIVCGVLIATVLGLVTGLIITKGRVSPFIATLGGMAVFRSLTLFLADGGEFRSHSYNVYGHIGMDSLWGIPYPVIVWLLLAAAGHVLLSYTRYGRYVYAVGSNERAVRYSAINVNKVKLITYTFMGACCGVSAVLLSSRLNSVSSSGTGIGYELDAIAAAIIGGTRIKGGAGTIWGTVLGVIMLGVINNMLNLLNVSAYLQGTVKGLIIIGAVLLQRGKEES
jgi:ribose transport system permease protein